MTKRPSESPSSTFTHSAFGEGFDASRRFRSFRVRLRRSLALFRLELFLPYIGPPCPRPPTMNMGPLPRSFKMPKRNYARRSNSLSFRRDTHPPIPKSYSYRRRGQSACCAKRPLPNPIQAESTLGTRATATWFPKTRAKRPLCASPAARFPRAWAPVSPPWLRPTSSTRRTGLTR